MLGKCSIVCGPFCNTSDDLERRIVAVLRERGLLGDPATGGFDRLLEVEFRQMPEMFQRLISAGFLQAGGDFQLYEIGEWGLSFWFVCSGGGRTGAEHSFDGIVSVPMANIVSISTFHEERNIDAAMKEQIEHYKWRVKHDDPAVARS